MYFNIAFDIVTLLIILGIALSKLIIVGQKTRGNSAYNYCLALLAVSTFFDILAALTGANIIFDSDELNIVFETVYMCTGLYCLYASFLTVSMRIQIEYRKSSQFMFTLVSIYTFLLLINIPTKLLYNIVDGVFYNNFLFYVAYIIPVYVMLYSVYTLFKNRHLVEKKIFVAMVIAACCPIIGVIIQLINDRLILIQFGLAITLLIINIIWETPDSQALKQMIAELEKTRQDEENSRTQTELSNNIKNNVISIIAGNIPAPLSQIEEQSQEIIELNESDSITNNAKEILDASNQLSKLVNQLIEN